MSLKKFKRLLRAVNETLFNLIRNNFSLVIFVFSLYILRVIRISQKNMSELITFIPDDAFYYLTIAKQKNEARIWTFDGVNSTSGFHFLHAKVLEMIFKMFPEISVKSLFIIFGVLCSFGLSLLLFAILRYTDSSNVSMKLTIIVPFLLPATLRLSEMIMESWIIPIVLGVALVLARKIINVAILRFLLLVMGFLGVLARTDFLIITACAFISVLGLDGLRRLSRYKSPDSSHEILKTITASFFVMGSILGEAFISGRNYFLNDELVQMSVQIKRKWSDILGNPIELSLFQFFKFISPLEFPVSSLTTLKVLIALLVLFLFVCLVSVWKNVHLNWQEGQVFCLLYTLISIPLLTLFFRYNAGSLQPWYSVTYIPTVVCIVISMHTIARKKFLINMSLFVLSNFLVFSSLFGSGLQGQFKSHEIMYRTAINLGNENSYEPIGAWNAGILKYFSNQNIINLDGLMNDTAAKYILSDTLYNYIVKHKINRLVDFSGTISHPKSELKYGLIKGELSRCFSPVRLFTSDEFVSPFGTYSEFRLRPDCVELKK
jgi:hypothetical protein